MPVHGEWRHLVANAELAVATGVPRDRVVVAEDGVVVDLVDGVASIAGAVPCGYVYVDGASVGEADEALLKDRRILRDEGFISVIVVIDASTGQGRRRSGDHGPGVHRGAGALRRGRAPARRGAGQGHGGGITDTYQLQQVIRRCVGGWMGRTIRRRPMIIPVVIES
jgi:ribonuclease J